MYTIYGDMMKYITRSNVGILIDGQEYSVGLKKYLNSLCIKGLSTFDGRVEASKIILKKRTNPPVFISPEVCLFPTKSIRDYNMIYINYFEVLSVSYVDNKSCLLVFNDLSRLYLDIPKNRIDKQLKYTEKILLYL